MGFDAPVPKPKLTRDRVLFELSGTDAAESFEAITPNVDLEDIYRRFDNVVPPEEWERLEPIAIWLSEQGITDAAGAEAAQKVARKLFHCVPKKSMLGHVFAGLVTKGTIPPENDSLALRAALVKKATKSQSGVLVITVLTSPYPKVGAKTQKFSCKWNCYYCPNEPGQPRSYLHDEPAVMRANQNGFDPVLQASHETGGEECR